MNELMNYKFLINSRIKMSLSDLLNLAHATAHL